MKNSTNKNNYKNKKPSILITTHLEEPNLLQLLIERLAESHHIFGCGLKKMQVGWQAIELSSIETFASGSIILSDDNELLSIPFVTGFLFTCIKAKQGKYSLTWNSSLS